jgi:thioredoxin 1
MIQVKKFYAEWCGPCKMLTPIMEQVQGKFSDISFESINIDSQFEVAQKYYVRSVPTVIIEKDGKEVHRFAGLQSEMAYSNALTELKQ